MKMDGPIVLRDPDAMRLGIGLVHRLVEGHQFLDPDFGARLG
jgi:hypothetical protein